MKYHELRSCDDCDICGKAIGEHPLKLFWVVKIQRHLIDMDAIRRFSGLALMYNSAAMAAVMGPNEKMTKPAMAEVTITVCEDCASMKSLPIAYMGLELKNQE